VRSLLKLGSWGSGKVRASLTEKASKKSRPRTRKFQKRNGAGPREAEEKGKKTDNKIPSEGASRKNWPLPDAGLDAELQKGENGRQNQ